VDEEGTGLGYLGEAFRVFLGEMSGESERF